MSITVLIILSTTISPLTADNNYRKTNSYSELDFGSGIQYKNYEKYNNPIQHQSILNFNKYQTINNTNIQQNFELNRGFIDVIGTKWQYNVSDFKYRDNNEIASFNLTYFKNNEPILVSQLNNFTYNGSKLPVSFNETIQYADNRKIERKWFDAKYYDSNRWCSYTEKMLLAENDGNRQKIMMLRKIGEPERYAIKEFKEQYSIDGKEKLNIHVKNIEYNDFDKILSYDATLRDALGESVNITLVAKRDYSKVISLNLNVLDSNQTLISKEFSNKTKITMNDCLNVLNNNRIPLLFDDSSLVRVKDLQLRISPQVNQTDVYLKFPSISQIKEMDFQKQERPREVIEVKVNRSVTGVFSAISKNISNALNVIGRAFRNLGYVLTGKWGKVKQLRTELQTQRKEEPMVLKVIIGDREIKHLSLGELELAVKSLKQYDKKQIILDTMKFDNKTIKEEPDASNELKSLDFKVKNRNISVKVPLVLEGINLVDDLYSEANSASQSSLKRQGNKNTSNASLSETITEEVTVSGATEDIIKKSEKTSIPSVDKSLKPKVEPKVEVKPQEASVQKKDLIERAPENSSVLQKAKNLLVGLWYNIYGKLNFFSNRNELTKGIFDANARVKGIKQIKRDRLGYLEGYQEWKNNKVNGEQSNNVLYVKDGKAYYKVYRKIDSGKGLMEIIKEDKITNKQYDKVKVTGIEKATWCNFAVRAIAKNYNIPDAFSNVEENANTMFSNLADRNSKYNTKNYRFKDVDWEIAETYASKGGFVIAIWDGTAKSMKGHVAVVLGGYYTEKSIKYIKIFQAGKENNFGEMSLMRGFDENKLKSIKYYIWERE
ncbi:MAG: hypothetical protein ABII27_08825 [bacterium]